MAHTVSTLAVERHFTEQGTDPYSQLKWAKRESLITNPKTGKVVFEQKDVEFPIDWSQNAINIVTQKYFYGTPGTKNREQSLKQLIDRVANTITKYGYEHGYFLNEAEADVFNDELKYILATQRAAFNSPVWFNIGTPDRAQQASACFILKVEDTMPSILNWYKEEGMIFKGGSGAGLNISSIRSSYETLGESAGTASGPLSFMRGADSSAGAIKSGGKTRRAAKMVILNISHPDIEAFVWCKAREERKAFVLQEAGFDMGINGEDSISIQYQNANNSVRVNDDFMKALDNDEDWDLIGVKDGKVHKTVKARKLWRQVAEAAWESADPGVQYDTVINDWHTTPKAGRIEGSNPCSEYMHLDNSACNLASINILKFLNSDGSFMVDDYRHVVETIFLAQEILVGYSAYPTEAIDKTARAYRELGMGYTNLGAALMAKGLAYDSAEGRAVAAGLTALMTGHSYATSARIAKRVGPFAGYEKDKKGMLRVLRKHRDAVSDIDASLIDEELLSAAANSWDEAVEIAEKHGVRNSQATLIAPTGTIAFMMDCDTTGIEPDFSLSKFKTLVGGGSMVIVNQTVPRALETLGYGESQAKDIIDYLQETHGVIIGAPHLKKEHYDVFATAVGENAIHYNGHIRMMGAVQPFLSGAISKTVNMPESATVEEVGQLYYDAWKLGIKAVAIYRDNSKAWQPLSDKKDGAKDKTKADQLVEAIAPQVAQGAMRNELPRKRNSKTFSFYVSDLHGHFTVGEYADGKPGELFIQVAKMGSTLAGVMEAFGRSVSYGLQYGVPLKAFVKGLTNTSFAPFGATDDPEIRTASSIMDYVFRRLALEYLNIDDRLELGLASMDELEAEMKAQQTSLIDAVPAEPAPAIANELVASAVTPPQDRPNEKAKQPVLQPDNSSAPLCSSCGNITQRAGSCYVCTSCGSTTGCS